MTITKKQLTKLNKFKKSTLLTLEHALIDSQFITAYSVSQKPNGQPVFLRLKHGWEVSEPVLFPVDKLVKIAKKYTIDRITTEEGKTVIHAGPGKFKAAAEDLGEFPEIPAAKSSGDKVDTKALKRLHRYASTDDLRPALCGVYFADEMVCTNGHIMRWETNPAGDVDPVVIPSEAINLLTESEHISVNLEGKYYALVGEVETVIYEPVPDEYANYKSVIPSEHKTVQTATLDKRQTKKAVEAAIIGGNDTTKQLRLHFHEDKTVTVHAEDIDLSSSFNSDPIGYYESKVEPFEIAFNGGFLLDTLKTMPDEFDVQMSGANKGARFDGNTLVMPVMIETYA